MRISRRTFVKGTASGLGAATIIGKGWAAGQAPQNPEKFAFETAPPPVPAGDIKASFTSDVVIVGVGVAGLVAGLSAVQAGASVNQIEKAAQFSARGGDNTAINSRIQEKLGIHLDANKIVHDLMRVQGGRLNQGILQLWVHNCGRVMNWILDQTEAEGLQSYLVIPDRTDQETFIIDRWPNPTGAPPDWNWLDEYAVEYPTCHRIGDRAANQRRWVSIIEKNSLAKGTKISYNTKAVRLVREGNGRVSAVIAQDQNGNYAQYNAKKGVILSTGDYSYNPDMIAKYFPGTDLKLGDIPTSMGEGHQMGMWIGAVMENTPHAPLNDIAHALGTDAFLLVNQHGKRFCNEDLDSEARARQAEEQGGCWLVVDASWPEDLSRMGMGFLRVWKDTPAVRKEFQNRINSGNVLEAESIEALAGKMKVSGNALTLTVRRYNELVKGGRDLDFGKRPDRMTAVDRPPFYAQWIPRPNHPNLVFGGLVADDHLQALGRAGDVIPGLYLAGNTVGGRFKVAYPLLCPGISHSMAWTTGYMASKFALGQT
jgi:fumarate reductase flavoprotein subunit